MFVLSGKANDQLVAKLLSVIVETNACCRQGSGDTWSYLCGTW